MRIFNQEKTQELAQESLDFANGYLKAEKRFVARHEAVPFHKGRTAQEIAQELEAQGVGVEIGYDGKPYKILEESEQGGRLVEEIKDEPDTPAKEAWDEYEDIQVFVPYTEEELRERHLQELRVKREPLLVAFDKYKSNVEYGIEEETEEQHTDMVLWYKSLLDLEERAFTEIPERLNYYLK